MQQLPPRIRQRPIIRQHHPLRPAGQADKTGHKDRDLRQNSTGMIARMHLPPHFYGREFQPLMDRYHHVRKFTGMDQRIAVMQHDFTQQHRQTVQHVFHLRHHGRPCAGGQADGEQQGHSRLAHHTKDNIGGA